MLILEVMHDGPKSATNSDRWYGQTSRLDKKQDTSRALPVSLHEPTTKWKKALVGATTYTMIGATPASKIPATLFARAVNE